MAPASSLGDERYVSLTTFTGDGRPKSTPVWIVDLGDGKIGCVTRSSSYKIKRLADDPRCTVQPCDARGNLTPGTEPVSGTAVAGPEHVAEITSRLGAKYGFQYRAIKLVSKVSRLVAKVSGADTGVVITLDDPSDE